MCCECMSMSLDAGAIVLLYVSEIVTHTRVISSESALKLQLSNISHRINTLMRPIGNMTISEQNCLGIKVHHPEKIYFSTNAMIRNCNKEQNRNLRLAVI